MNKKLNPDNIIAIKNGDEREFQKLFNLYYAKLSSYINTYTKDTDKTKDIVQEAFIKLWDNRKNIDTNSSILAYLHKIAYNIFIDNYRKVKRQQSLLDSLSYETINDMIEDDNNTLSKIEIVKKSIEELPPRCKEVFKLSKYEGLKYSEIAEALNISIKTVEAQMGKAFSQIRQQVKNSQKLGLYLIVLLKKCFLIYLSF